MNILLTSAGRRSYLVEYFKESLSGKGLVHAGNATLSAALLVADKNVITPLIYDNHYISFLLNYCRQYNISAIIPLIDIDVPILAKSKEMFKSAAIDIVVSDYEIAKICNDKWKTYNLFIKNNIKTPKTYLRLFDAYRALQKKVISFPLVIKPRWGMGSIGLYVAENTNELEILYHKSFNDVKKSYIEYESREDIEHCVLIQEYIEGVEYGLDVINDLKGEYITTFVKRKLAMRSGETDAASTEYNPNLKMLGLKISKLLKHVGVLDVDCFLCEETAFVLEINSRFGGHYPFSHLAGANIPEAIIKWLNNEIPDNRVFRIKYGINGMKDIRPILF